MTGDVTLGDVGCWVGAQGVRHIIVKASIHEEGSGFNRERSRQQLETLWQAKYDEGLDFSVDLYLYLHWPNNPKLDPQIKTPIIQQVREAIDILGELDIGFPPFPSVGSGSSWRRSPNGARTPSIAIVGALCTDRGRYGAVVENLSVEGVAQRQQPAGHGLHPDLWRPGRGQRASVGGAPAHRSCE